MTEQNVKLNVISCFLGVRMKRCQRCSTIHYTVQWENHGSRTKSTSRRTTSHQQTETLIAPRCPPHATAPSPALRPNLSLQPPSLCFPCRTRNQWCLHVLKGAPHTTGLLCLARLGRACRSPRTPETTETAPNSPANSDCQRDLASHCLTKTVRRTLTH